MKTYLVLQNCVHMPFRKGLFRKDEIVELDDSINPGANFKLVDQTTPEKKTDDGTSLSEMQQKQKEAATPKSGFAAGLNPPEEKPRKKKSR